MQAGCSNKLLCEERPEVAVSLLNRLTQPAPPAPSPSQLPGNVLLVCWLCQILWALLSPQHIRGRVALCSLQYKGLSSWWTGWCTRKELLLKR